MGNGSGAAALRTSRSDATTSISPVGSSGLALPSGRSADLAGDLDAELAAQLVGDGLVADHDLHDAAGLAQVDEGDAAVVAAAGHPAGQRHGLARVLGTQRAGVVGADQFAVSSIGVQASGSAGCCSPLRMSLTSLLSGNHT